MWAKKIHVKVRNKIITIAKNTTDYAYDCIQQLPHVIQTYPKCANFARLYFPHFGTCNFTNFSVVSSCRD